MGIRKLRITAKTVQEALAEAVNHYRIQLEKINYIVVDSGSKGWFYKRPAVIEISLDEQHMTPDNEANNERERTVSDHERTDIDGYAWVEDGRIYCKNGLHHYPLITVCEGVQVFVNGREVSGTVVVREEDHIVVESQSDLVETKISLSVAEDNMKATVKISPGYLIQRNLVNQPPSTELVLKTVERKSSPRNNVRPETIMDLLNKKGITFGIDFSSIDQACKVLEETEFVVARGKEPVAGNDGTLEFLYQKRRMLDEWDQDFDPDWKECFSLPKVQAGEVIGYIVPATKGKEGRNVFGDILPTTDGTEITVIAEEEVSLLETERKIVAKTEGRVKITKYSNNTFGLSILPQYIYTGNLDREERESIIFAGDVVICGDVGAGTKIQAGGNVLIKGSVSKADIQAAGDIKICGPVVEAKISNEIDVRFAKSVVQGIASIEELLERIITALRQLEANKSFSDKDLANQGLKPLLELLVKIKFQELPLRIQELNGIVKQDVSLLKNHLVPLVKTLHDAFVKLESTFSNVIEITECKTKLGSLKKLLILNCHKKANIRATSFTRSRVSAQGNIYVDKFSYASNLDAKGKVIINGRIRNGNVQATDAVVAHEAGSLTNNNVFIKVLNEKGQIKMNQVWAATSIQIGDTEYKFPDNKWGVQARLMDGKVVVEENW
ncbi:FapA family protein [Effusibacillus lacus]|uniref:RNA-binding protein KhpB N-terminal domain-containing protein n=1 Tax=Effusibacillus lacus TaxID=1348429 RepID=A0A292YPY4_9BACL|nr:FapA family protein [Effusibacillus lacus]TCS73495.1 jag family protein [Effusibacillus lacus]GAX92008.1 hypothetical protein EFBL_3699 [Effusibacillus lacus]